MPFVQYPGPVMESLVDDQTQVKIKLTSADSHILGRTLSIAGSSCSGRSASLQIVWEGGQQWDDEFAEGE